MTSQNQFTKADQSQKVERLHQELRQWQSNLYFMQDEILFIDHLLNAYIFQPTTPNLFERIQDYLFRLKKVKQQKEKLGTLVSNHEKNLVGMLRCTNSKCDEPYYQRHDTMKVEVTKCLKSFQMLKSEIFNYAGGILKKNKPKSNP